MNHADSVHQLRAIQEGLRIGLEELLARRDYARVEDILRALDRSLDPLIARSGPLAAPPQVEPSA